jgi:tape measure domain-containing protein
MADLGLTIKISADGKNASAEIANLDNQVNKLDRSLKNSSSSASNQERSLSSLGRTAAATAAAYVTVGTAIAATRAAIEAADRFQLLEGRLRLVSNSATQFAGVYRELFRISQETASDLESNVALYTRMARAFEGTGRSAADMLAIVKTMAQALRISGSSTQEAQSAILQFSQAMASGKLQGEEFRSLMENAPTLMAELAKAIGVPIGQLKSLATEGKLTADTIADAMVKMRQSFDEQARALPSTFGQSFQRLTTSLQAFMAEVATASGMVKTLADGMNSLASYFDRWRSTGSTNTLKEQAQLVNELGTKLVTLKARGAGIGDIDFAQKQFDEADKLLQQMIAQEKQVTAQTTEMSKGFGDVGYKIENVGKKAEDTIAAIAQAARKAGIPEQLAVTVAKLESNFNQGAVSDKGATGVMQLMPKYFGNKGNINNAMENIRIGVEELARLYKKYDGDLVRVLAAYNGGEGNLAKYGTGAGWVKDYLAAYDKAARDLKAKYPNGLLADTLSPKQQEQLTRSQFETFSAELDTMEAKTKAAMDKRNAEIDTQIEKQKARIQEFDATVSRESSQATGANKVAYLTQAAEQEKAMQQELLRLQLSKVSNEETYARVKLANINAIIAAENQYKLTEQQHLQLTSQREQAEANLAQLSAQRAQLEIQSGTKASQLASDIASAQQQETDGKVRSAQAIADYLQSLDDQIAALQDQNNLLSEEQRLREVLVGLSNEEADAVEATAKKKLAEIEALNAAKKEQADSEKAVKDEVLRMGQYYQTMVRQAQQSAQGMAEAFGKTGAAIGQVVAGLAQYNETMYQSEQRIKSIQSDKTMPDAEKMTAIQREQSNQLSAQIHQYGNLTQAAGSFFEEGTSGYNAMQAATKAFRMIELALTLSNYIQMAVAGWTFTGQDVAQKQMQGQAAAAVGVANQANGEPYSAWIRMAAMAATMAALGFGVGMGGGNPGKQGAVGKTTAVNTGTVTGDEAAKSQSISNSLEILKNNSSADLDYSAKMTKALENIDASLKGATTSLLVNVNALTALTGQNVKWVNNNKGLFGEPTLFMNTRSKITDFGIGTLNPQLLSEVLKSGLELKSYTDVTTTTKLFGMTLSSKTKTYLGQVAQETEDAFTKVIRSLADAVQEGAKAFGISSMEFQKRLAEFTVSIDPQSLKGTDGKKLTGKELQEALSAQFSAIADRMAKALNIDELESFNRVGEGMFETLTRVASGINQAKGALEQLNIAAVSYKDVVNRQAEDVGAEIVRQSIIMREAGSSVGKFMEDAVGSLDDLVAVYQDLVAVRDLFTGMGIEANALTRAMTEAVGGVANLRNAMEDFNSNFFSAGEQYANSLVTISRQFGELGLVLPTSKEGFRELALSIDTTTEEGQKLFARVVALSGAFADAADAADELEKKYKNYINPLGTYAEQLQTIVDDFKDILDAKLGQVESDFANRAALAKKAVNDPLQADVDKLTAYRSIRQSEINTNLGFLNTTLSEISKYQDLIARWEGVPKAAQYVASWRQQLGDLNAQADILRGDLSAKQKEIDSINTQIQGIIDQMAKNSADIDSAQLGEKLKALTDERKRILRQEGEVLLSSLRDFWNDMIRGIEDLQNTIASKIADLKGGNAPLQFAKQQLQASTDAYREYRKSGVNDPQKGVELITDMINNIMSVYDQQVERIQKGIQRKTNAINKQLESDIETINVRRDRKLAAVDRAEEARTNAARDAAEARIDAIQAALKGAERQLEDRQQEATWSLEDQQSARRDALQKTQNAEMEALQDQLNIANQLKSAFAQIKQYAEGLKTGALSSLSPEDKIKEARQQYATLVALAKGGDAEAAGKVSGQADVLLNLLRQYFGGSTAYATEFERIQKELEALGNTQTNEVSVQSKIDQLKEQQSADMKALERTFQVESRALSRAQSDEMDRLRESFQSRIDSVNDTLDNKLTRISKQFDNQRQDINDLYDKKVSKAQAKAQKAIEDLSDPEKNLALKTLRDRTIAKLERLNELLAYERTRAVNQMATLIDEVKGLNILNRAQLRQLNKMAANMGVDVVPAAASGGYLGAGLALVGEKGPELVNFAKPAQVIDANNSKRIMTSEDDEKITKAIGELKTELQAIVNSNAMAYPRMVQSLERMDDRLSTIERNARLSA